MKFLILTYLLATSALTIHAQSTKLEFPAPSPACTLKQRIGLTDITIDYSRPGVKGRQIFGGMVPYDAVWRTGANQATKITFSTDVKLNGTAILAGTYALFTIPGQDEWTIIINKGAAQWGAFQYNQKDDVARFKATPVQVDFAIETFTIEFNAIRDESARMDLLWDHTAVPINIDLDVSSQLVPRIEAAMASDDKNKPYYQAALYYYQHNLDMQKASKWVDAAIAQREAHYIVYLKAEILARLGDKAGAIAAANRSIELATQAKDTGYIKLNQDLIASQK